MGGIGALVFGLLPLTDDILRTRELVTKVPYIFAASSLVGTIASFAGMQPGIMKTLLTYLAPIVLGTVANSFKGAKPDAAGLMRLFSEQQDNIKAALPRTIESKKPLYLILDGDVAQTVGGILKEVSLAYVPEAKLGDFVLVHVGVAISVVDPKEAEETFAYVSGRLRIAGGVAAPGTPLVVMETSTPAAGVPFP